MKVFCFFYLELKFLFRIVKNRASLKNFQLIVITHDEDFVDSLGKSAYADKCYRVSKTNKYVG